MKFLGAILFILVLSSCVNKSSRVPASTMPLFKLVSSMQEALNKEAENGMSTKECVDVLGGFYLDLFSIEPTEVGFETLSMMQRNDLIDSSFNLRVKMKERLRALRIEDKVGKQCYQNFRNLYRALRYFEDYLVEQNAIYENRTDKETYINLKGEGSYFKVNDQFQFKGIEDLKSGDVILSRGNAYSSAAIARIGEIDAQFSHLSFVYIDDDGKVWTTEAHIEIGSVIAPISKHINQKNARTVVYRYKDSELAHKASYNIWKRVKEASEKTRSKNELTGLSRAQRKEKRKSKNIPYDFSMDHRDTSTLFCSEIIYAGFHNVTNGEVDIPKYKTKFSPKLLYFLNQIGIKVNAETVKDFETFSPADIEYDDDFTLVAEWRNPGKIRDSRFKDAILTKVMEWMEDKNYRFRTKKTVTASHVFAYTLRRAGLFKEKFPLNMGVKQLNLFVTLEQISEALYEEVEELQKEKDYPLTFSQIFQFLESLREEDQKAYSANKKDAIFHGIFRP